MFQRILVPLDGSQRAERALSVAVRVARATNGMIVLLRVVSPLIGYPGGLVPAPFLRGELIEQECAEATAYLATVAQSEDLKGIHTQTQVKLGLAAERILDEIKSQGIGLTILCSHGRTGFKRWALGSVAQRVIHHSPVPTLVLREKGAALPTIHADSARPLCAIVSLDGSPLAEAALVPTANLVAALATPAQGVVHLMHVVKPLTAAFVAPLSGTQWSGSSRACEASFNNRYFEGLPQYEAEAVSRAQTYLQNVRERLLAHTRDLNLLVTWSVTQAEDIAETIVTTAEEEMGSTGENSSDILAMATHGRGGLERWVMGSFTERVLNASRLPMLIIRPQQSSQG
jgi:nucleotide-binding universal stress UspA family protein